MKEKAIEICKNITQTLNKIGDTTNVASDNPMFKGLRITKEVLTKKRTEIKKKYNI